MITVLYQKSMVTRSSVSTTTQGRGKDHKMEGKRKVCKMKEQENTNQTVPEAGVPEEELKVQETELTQACQV